MFWWWQLFWPLFWAAMWAAFGIYLLAGLLILLLATLTGGVGVGVTETPGGLRELLWHGWETVLEVVAWPWHARSWWRRQSARRFSSQSPTAAFPASGAAGGRDPVRRSRSERRDADELYQQAWHGH